MRHIERILIIIFTFALLNVLNAQVPEMEWFKAQGTNTEEHVHEGMQTSDGGYIAVGHGIESSDSDDILVIKVNQSGSLEWEQDFGTAGERGCGYCITEVADGFVAGGAIYDPASQRTQRFLVKLDFNGDVIWEKYFASEGVGGIRGIDVTNDGGIVITGYKNTPDTYEFRGFVFIVDDGDGFLMKLDPEGNVIWEKEFDAPQGTKIRTLNDGFAVASCVWTWSQEAGDHQDFCLIKFDTEGNTVWNNLYGGEKSDHLYDFDLTSDGGFILGGHTVSYGVENWDFLMMKIDGEGNEEWHKIFGQPRGYDPNYIHDEAYGVRETTDGGFIICGGSGDEHSYSESGHDAGPSDEWKVSLFRTDASGNTLWSAVYPPYPVGNNAGEYIGLTDDGGYIVFVDTDSQSYPAPNNYGFIKLSTDPVTSVSEEESGLPVEFDLLQNYPNPFNPVTNITYSISEAGFVQLSVYNILGVEVERLVNEFKAAGINKTQFDGSNLSSGIYFCKLQAPSNSKTIKMILVK